MTVSLVTRPWRSLGWAVSQLALASCAGALTSPGRQGDVVQIMFTSHHKTGTNLGLELEACFAGVSDLTSDLTSKAKRCKEERTLDDLTWDGAVPHGCDRLVHFVRTPREVVRSAYLYHRQRPPVEPWLARPAVDILGEAVPDNPFSPGETYNQYLARVPIPVGLYAEMKFQFADNFKTMEVAYNVSKDDSRVQTVCLEEAWQNYEEMVRKMASHLKLPYNDGVQKCTERHNPSEHTFGTHTTHGTLTQAETAELRQVIANHDEKWFDGRFGKSALADMCKSKIKHRRAESPDSSDEWLDGFA
jgi:hypothetical protein